MLFKGIYKTKTGFLLLFLLLAYSHIRAQQDSTTNRQDQKAQIAQQKYQDSLDRRDVIDVLLKILNKQNFKRSKLEPGNTSFIILPGINYSVLNGLAYTLSSTITYYASDYKDQNLSAIYANASYSVKSRKTLTVYSHIWTKKNNFSFQGVAWYLNQLEHTYGLGSDTHNEKKNLMNYTFIRVHESVLKKIFNDVYLGVGYRLNYHYAIHETGNQDGSTSDYQKFSTGTHSRSYGYSVDFLFDDRRNLINPKKGSYINVVYSPKLKSWGSNYNWQDLKVDLRKYIKVGDHPHNVLALWSLSQFSFGSTIPYLDMPSTGWDDQQRTGRGYVQGRFRGKDMLYFEGEYRFGITHNGLLGGVVFANAESFTNTISNHFERLLPAAGAGLRIKLNKFQRTNLTIDYAVGVNNSSGLYINVGEYF